MTEIVSPEHIVMVHTCLHLAAIGREQDCHNLQMKHVMHLMLLLILRVVWVLGSRY
jgi:hypothetical protein